MLFWSRDYVGAENPKTIAIRRGDDYVRAGLVGQVCGVFGILIPLEQLRMSVIWLGVVILVLATAVLVTGCIRHAVYKHYHWRVGVTLGLLSLPGVIVLHLLPDWRKRMMRRRGFDVVMPRKVSSTWVTNPDDPEAPRFRRGGVVRYEEPADAD
jgi:hypothetical protein